MPLTLHGRRSPSFFELEGNLAEYYVASRDLERILVNIKNLLRAAERRRAELGGDARDYPNVPKLPMPLRDLMAKVVGHATIPMDFAGFEEGPMDEPMGGDEQR